MPIFSSSDEFRLVLEAVFARAASGPAARALCGAKLALAFEYSDPDLVLMLDGSGHDLRVSFGSAQHADVTFSSSADVGHAFWSGRLNVAAALALGRVQARGSVSRALALLPVMSELTALYREVYGQRADLAPHPPSAAPSAPFATAREGFHTVRRGLDHTSFPMRLYHKAKQLGTWDPAALDLTRDRADWQALRGGEQRVLAALTTLFVGGEEGVTLDLLPLIATVAREGRVEEELYLTTFLWEEAKHTEFFDRVLREVMDLRGDLADETGPHYRRMFERELPESLSALWRDPSPSAQARASVTYNMIVEGVLAETGYHAYRTMLASRGVMPGLLAGIDLLQRDESRHIAFGLYFLARLVRESPELWDEVTAHMEALLPIAVAIIPETLSRFSPEDTFGLDLDATLDFALGQFRKRLTRIERARHGQVVDDVLL